MEGSHRWNFVTIISLTRSMLEWPILESISMTLTHRDQKSTEIDPPADSDVLELLCRICIYWRIRIVKSYAWNHILVALWLLSFILSYYCPRCDSAFLVLLLLEPQLMITTASFPSMYPLLLVLISSVVAAPAAALYLCKSDGTFAAAPLLQLLLPLLLDMVTSPTPIKYLQLTATYT